ncbi:MAG: hypothetical protein AAB784_02500 [Patescibacteria group bacterium]
MTKEELLAVFRANSGLYQSYPEAMFLACWSVGNVIVSKLLSSSCDVERVQVLFGLMEVKSRLNMFVTALSRQMVFDQSRPDHFIDAYQKIVEAWWFIYENYDRLLTDEDWMKNFTKEQVGTVCNNLQERQDRHKIDFQKNSELKIDENELEMLTLVVNYALRFLLGRSCKEFIDEYNSAIEILRQLQIAVFTALMPNGPDNQERE